MEHGHGRVLLLLLLFAVIWCSFFPPSRSISYDERLGLEAFKKFITKDPFSVLADWNHNVTDPCKWNGVSCSETSDHVVALNLSNSSLIGFLPQEVGSLTYLQELNLSHNLFLGEIPKEIGMLQNLLVLDMSDNRLTGPIPPEIRGLSRITKINFHLNGLTGYLPAEIGNLASLLELRLDRNRFQGTLPGSERFSFQKNASGICLLKQLKIGDFSYNFLTGQIPRCLEFLGSPSFQGNCFHDKGAVLQRATHICESSATVGSTNKRAKPPFEQQIPQQPLWLLMLEIVTGIMFLVFVATVVAIALKRIDPKFSTTISRKRATYEETKMMTSIDDEILKNVLRLSRQELEVACEDFSNIIGTSSDSIVYKGTMKDGHEVAVIALCVSQHVWNNSLELYFQCEVANLSRLKHANTAKLLGYCKEDDPFSRMLIFEYASNGTLYEHLHYGEGSQLLWSRRMKIVLGIARSLKYLHIELQPPFCLSELQSSSVYLTEDFEPKLVDFESCRAAYTESPRSSNMDAQGNIFAFGVLLLEIISGRPPYCKDRGYLVDWAMEYLEKPEMICHLIDPELRYFNHDDLLAICTGVACCLQSEPSKRPSMEILLPLLENGIDTSASANLKESSLAWAELALLSP